MNRENEDFDLESIIEEGAEKLSEGEELTITEDEPEIDTEEETEQEESEGDDVDTGDAEDDAEGDDAEEDAKSDGGDSDDADSSGDEGEKNTDDDHAEFAEKITKKETRERFNSVLSESKERKAKIEQLEQQLVERDQRIDQIRTDLFAGGLEQQELSDGMAVMEGVKNLDASTINQHWDKIQQFITVVETIAGKPLNSGVDYRQFEDIAKRVDEVEIDEATAAELAQTRLRENMRTERAQAMANAQAQGQQRQQAVFQQDMATATAAIEAKVNVYMTTPGFANQRAALQQQFLGAAQNGLQSGQIQPKDLPALFDRVVQNGFKAPTQEKREDTADVNPLRSSSNKTTQTKKLDTDSDDWVSQALGGAR